MGAGVFPFSSVNSQCQNQGGQDTDLFCNDALPRKGS